MSPTDYHRKLCVINARIALLLAQKAELLHKQQAAARTPATKRAKPKAPSKKKPVVKKASK